MTNDDPKDEPPDELSDRERDEIDELTRIWRDRDTTTDEKLIDTFSGLRGHPEIEAEIERAERKLPFLPDPDKPQ